MPAYANGWYQTEREPAKIAALAKRVVARGYRGLKLDPFGHASAELSAAERRQRGGDRRRRARGRGARRANHDRDARPIHAVQAAAMAKLLEPFDPEWIEEPTPPENALAYRPVRSATHLPIATGERAHAMEDIRGFIEGGLVDIVQVDLTHFGGFLADEAAGRLGGRVRLVLAPHNVCGPVGTMANLHFAVATPNYKVLEHFNDFADEWVHELVDHSPRIDPSGRLFRGARSSGLGLSLNHDECAKHPRTGGRIKLFEEGWEKR